MSTQNDELVAGVKAVSGSLSTIKDGIAALVGKIPVEGGLSADETFALRTQLSSLVSQANDVVAALPAAPVEPAA